MEVEVRLGLVETKTFVIRLVSSGRPSVVGKKEERVFGIVGFARMVGTRVLGVIRCSP